MIHLLFELVTGGTRKWYGLKSKVKLTPVASLCPPPALELKSAQLMRVFERGCESGNEISGWGKAVSSFLHCSDSLLIGPPYKRMLLLLPFASDAAPCRLNRLGGAGGVMKVPIIIWWKMLLSPWMRKEKRKSGCPKERMKDFILRRWQQQRHYNHFSWMTYSFLIHCLYYTLHFIYYIIWLSKQHENDCYFFTDEKFSQRR